MQSTNMIRCKQMMVRIGCSLTWDKQKPKMRWIINSTTVVSD